MSGMTATELVMEALRAGERVEATLERYLEAAS